MNPHAEKRARQRYGISFGVLQQQDAVRQIQENKNRKTAKRLTVSRSVHNVKVMGMLIPVIYSRKQKSIITVINRNHEAKLLGAA